MFSVVFYFNDRLPRPCRVLILVATMFSILFTNGVFFREEESYGGELDFNFAELFWISLWSFLLTKPLIILAAFLMRKSKPKPE